MKKGTTHDGKEAVKMPANILVTLMAVGIMVAYLAVVIVPLLATVFGGVKLLGLRRESEGVILFQEGLGFTMADGGEKEKKEE